MLEITAACQGLRVYYSPSLADARNKQFVVSIIIHPEVEDAFHGGHLRRT
jgi:hypothetical protein